MTTVHGLPAGAASGAWRSCSDYLAAAERATHVVLHQGRARIPPARSPRRLGRRAGRSPRTRRRSERVETANDGLAARGMRVLAVALPGPRRDAAGGRRPGDLGARPGPRRAGRHDRPGPARGARGGADRHRGRHPPGDDHRRPAPHGGEHRRAGGHRRRAEQAAADAGLARCSPASISTALVSRGTRARPSSEVVRLRPGGARAEAHHRAGPAGAGAHRGHDRRRRQRRPRPAEGRHRRGHGHHRHRRRQGSRRHGPAGRQLRHHRGRGQGRPGHLRQHPQVHQVPHGHQRRRADGDARRARSWACRCRCCPCRSCG